MRFNMLQLSKCRRSDDILYNMCKFGNINNIDKSLFGSEYTVYDNTGRVVLSGKINSQNTIIDLGNLSDGIYFFSMEENMKQTFKVIKE